MKKFISFISVLAIVLGCISPMAVFADATPTMKVDIDKITDFTGDYASLEELSTDYGLEVYVLTFSATGIPMSATFSGMGTPKKLTGDSIVGYDITMDVTSDGDLDSEWTAQQLYTLHSSPTSSWSNGDTTWAVTATGTTTLYPVGGSTTTPVSVSATDEIPLYKFMFAASSECPVTVTFSDYAIYVGTFNKDSITTNTPYMKSSSSLQISQASITLPLADSTVDVESVTISGATAATVGDNVQLSATVLPDNATDKTVTWTKVSGNGAVSSSGVVTATAAGDVVVKATAGGVDSANYTVSFAAAVPADIVPAVADKDTYSNASTGLQDAFGNDVTIDSSRSYGAAKFENVVLDDGEYVYKVFATGTNKATGLEETKSWDVVDGSVELTGASVSFIAIVRSATHTITSVVLKAFAK